MILDKRGFTLVELIITIGIAGILFGMGGSFSISVVAKIRTRIEVAKATELLYQARQLARTSGYCTVVDIGTNSIEVRAYEQADCTLPMTTPVKKSLPVLNFASGISLVPPPGSNLIVFNTFGSTIYNAPIEFRINNGSVRQVLTIFPVTGLVRSAGLQSIADTAL